LAHTLTTEQRRRLPRAHASIAAAAVALAACAGGGDDSPGASPTPAPTPAPFSTLNPVGSTGSIEARTSQAPTNGAAPSEVLDDFTLASATTVRTLRWQGIYCVAQDNAPAPTATASSFVISFYADANGQPDTGTPLQRTTVAVADAAQTLERNLGGLTCTGGNNTTWALYDYRATLSTPFSAAAGTKYWVSVQAVTPSYDIFWGWRNGTVNNSLSLQCFQGACTSYAFDRAYALGL
jgi:hypothetical protein